MNPLEIKQIKQVRILIWQVEPLLALGLAAVLRQQAGYDVLTPGKGSPASLDGSVDIVIADRQGVLELTAESAHAQRRARILLLTSRDREQDARDALEAGVDGYLLLGGGIDELTSCINVVASGASYRSPAVTQRISEGPGRAAPAEREMGERGLFARERYAGTLAHRLRNTIGTVRTHVRALMGRPDAFRRNRTSRIASRRGLVDEPHASPKPEWSSGATSPSTSYVLAAEVLS